MDDLDKLDFDVSYGDQFSTEEPKLIDVYPPKKEESLRGKEDDKFVSFSADLIKCFKSKIKQSSARLRVDSLINIYKTSEESYKDNQEYTLSEWCMANVNRFLDIAEGKDFNLSDKEVDIGKAKKDLIDNDLKLKFESVNQLYIETRKEAIDNAIASRIEI
tara:strand:+ start:876 stop:1358 length:483 start_codon:yes stop_codon:yes gene_type:complete